MYKFLSSFLILGTLFLSGCELGEYIEEQEDKSNAGPAFIYVFHEDGVTELKDLEAIENQAKDKLKDVQVKCEHDKAKELDCESKELQLVLDDNEEEILTEKPSLEPMNDINSHSDEVAKVEEEIETEEKAKLDVEVELEVEVNTVPFVSNYELNNDASDKKEEGNKEENNNAQKEEDNNQVINNSSNVESLDVVIVNDSEEISDAINNKEEAQDNNEQDSQNITPDQDEAKPEYLDNIFDISDDSDILIEDANDY